MHKQAITLAILLAALALAACRKEEPIAEEIRPVRTQTIAPSGSGGTSEYAGEIRARHETALAFRIGGKLIARLVDVGATVTAGQVIARLDAQDVVLNADAARAQTEAARTELVQLKLDLTRAQELLAKKFVSQAEVDRRLTSVVAAERKLEQAQAQEKMARNQAGYATLLADAPSIVTSVEAEPGQVLAAGQTVVRLARHGEREVVIDLAENQRAGIQAGQKAEVTLWALPGKTFSGRVREIAPAADPLSRTYRVRVTLNAVDENVRLGMSATVKLGNSEPAQNITLPLTAVYGTGSAQRVWLVDPATTQVKSVAVKVMDFESDRLQAAGLKAGDIVVTAGVNLLREGQKVHVMQNASQAGS